MSKMDNLRAMREARYEAAQARAKGTSSPAKTASTPAKAPVKKAKPKKAATPTSAASDSVATDEPCGHRNMSGRTCTRPQGHSEKSHRYS